MKFEKHFIFIYLFLIIISSCSVGTDPENTVPDEEESMITSTRFYVSISGDDSRTSAQANNPLTPWKTIQKAVDNISGGDTILIGGGTYYEKVSVTASSSGTAGNPQNKF
jgi:hypothetical protein